MVIPGDSTITTSQVMALIGYSSIKGTAAWLHRHKVPAVARDPGRSGENRYRRDDVEAALRLMPGRGTRTDLHQSPRAQSDSRQPGSLHGRYSDTP